MGFDTYKTSSKISLFYKHRPSPKQAYFVTCRRIKSYCMCMHVCSGIHIHCYGYEGGNLHACTCSCGRPRALATLTSTGPQLVSGLARQVTGVPAATGDRCISVFDLYRSAAREYFEEYSRFFKSPKILDLHETV